MDPAKMDPMNPITGNPFVGMNGNPMALIDSTGRFAEDGHFYPALYVSLRLGIPRETAQTIALYAQMPDEVGAYDAINRAIDSVRSNAQQTNYSNAPSTSGRPIAREFSRNEIQGDVHALNFGNAEFETIATRDAIEKLKGDDAAAIGVLVHRLGDTFAHRGMLMSGTLYPALIGHGLMGTMPDQIANRPDLFRDYVAELAGALNVSYNRQVSDKEQAKIVDEMMNGFNRANSRIGALADAKVEEARARHDQQIADLLASGQRLYWPPQKFDPSFAVGQQNRLRAGQVRKETIGEFVQMIEKIQGEKQLIRPENNNFSIWQAEGNEVEHLRIFYRSTGMELTDEELETKAQMLRRAVQTSITRVEEAKNASGTVKVPVK